jgi:hypothetical protein
VLFETVGAPLTAALMARGAGKGRVKVSLCDCAVTCWSCRHVRAYVTNVLCTAMHASRSVPVACGLGTACACAAVQRRELTQSDMLWHRII